MRASVKRRHASDRDLVQGELAAAEDVLRLGVELVRDLLETLGPVEPQDAADRAGVVGVDPVGEAVGLRREEVRVRLRRDARDLGEVLLEQRLVDGRPGVVDEAVLDDLLEETARRCRAGTFPPRGRRTAP